MSNLKSRHFGSDEGLTIIELLVSLTVFSVVFGMALMIATSANTLVTSDYQQGLSTIHSVSIVQTIRHDLSEVASPTVIAGADNDLPTGNTTPPNTTVHGKKLPICWSTTFTKPANSVTQTAQATKTWVAKPSRASIEWAHPFDLRYCASTGGPLATEHWDVYRLWMNPTTCTDKGTANDFCALELDSYGHAGKTTPTVLRRWYGVECNTQCQSDDKKSSTWSTKVTPATKLTVLSPSPALFSYYGDGKTTATTPTPKGLSTPKKFDDASKTDGRYLCRISHIKVNLTALVGTIVKTGSPRSNYRTEIWLPNASEASSIGVTC